MAGAEESQIVESEINGTQDNEQEATSSSDRLTKLPMSRIKHIFKSDPDVTLASQDAVVVITKATELFVQMIAKDASISTVQGNRKTLQRKDLDNITDRKDCYYFLEGALE